MTPIIHRQHTFRCTFKLRHFDWHEKNVIIISSNKPIQVKLQITYQHLIGSRNNNTFSFIYLVFSSLLFHLIHSIEC